MKSDIPTIIAILGPTASGKTAYAIDVAKRLNGAIISADSRQVYASMNIGTAKPREVFTTAPHDIATPDIIDSIPHYLLNITSIDTTYTLSDWLRDAEIAIQEITKQHKQVIIAGGTMLYIDALLDGYDIPHSEPDLEFRAKLEQESPETLYTKLRQQDPASCTFIEPHNTRRMIRALEVMQATGEKFSDLRKAHVQYNSTRIGIFPDWDVMRSNIQKRSQGMLADGLVQEAVTLRNTFPSSTLLQTINYKQALELADSKITEEEAITSMSQTTLRYAHRQMSWWNRRKDIGWICAQ